MKYCPYCGASVPYGAASFCAECGKTLPLGNATVVESSTADEESAYSQSSSTVHEEKKKSEKKRPRRPFRRRRSNVDETDTAITDSKDSTYDGYYDDVLPMDDSVIRESLEPELIKRIVMVAIGTLLIVGLSIAVMYVL